jgi:thiamine biosynthesis lipoprotein
VIAGGRLASSGSLCRKAWLRLACVSVLGLFCAGCSRAPEPAQFSGPTMGTTYHVTVTGAGANESRLLVQKTIDDVLLEVDKHLSTYNDASEISLLNRDRTGAWQDVSPTLLAVVQEASRASELTGGAFDITVAPLLQLWDFDVTGRVGDAREPFDAPNPAQIREARRSVGCDKLELRKNPRAAVRKIEPATQLTVDGIAPGYAVDRIAADLQALGYRDFIVEIGGEVRAEGQRPEGGPWRIAIEVPRALGREPLVGIRLRDAAVSTSGDYRDERVDRAGRRYSHTIDPRTGRPVQGPLTSVTVIDASATRADAYATALMVMGTAAGLEWARQLRVPVLFVERTSMAGEWRMVESPAFKEWRE